jgi:hypothetical protein
MKKQILVVISILLALTLLISPGKSMAATTQGQVALSLATILGLNVTTQEDAANALTALGITPGARWNIAQEAPCAFGFIGDLYNSIRDAIEKKKITPPTEIGNASALTAAACVDAGMASACVVDSIVSAGGDRESAWVGVSAIVSNHIGHSPLHEEGEDPDIISEIHEPGYGGGAGGGKGSGTQSQ